ncbi:WHG domain-containing protein [Rhodococcus sp. HNM0569]|uniref:TetR/AcrR family transcriptional regulator n=1 Tax=Rhodococcus sp. HNM0569 TaxID=2716340 RepID=UPI003211E463
MRAGLTTDRVVRAAAELADDIGFDAVTLSEVARRFGVRVASLYSHVASLHDLRSRIAVLALAEVAARASDAVAGRSGKEALVGLADVYRDYAGAHPGRYAAMQYRLDPEVAVASAGPALANLTRAVLRGYDIAEPDATHAVRLLGSVFHGYVSLEGSGGFAHSMPDSSESWARSLDALDALLRNWPTQATTTTDSTTRWESS